MNPLSDGIGNEPKWNVHIPINPNGKQEEKQPHKDGTKNRKKEDLRKWEESF